MKTETDLFANLDKVPKEVREAIQSNHEQHGESYEGCKALVVSLNALGWTCDYGLDAIPYDLKRIDYSPC